MPDLIRGSPTRDVMVGMLGFALAQPNLLLPSGSGPKESGRPPPSRPSHRGQSANGLFGRPFISRVPDSMPVHRGASICGLTGTFGPVRAPRLMPQPKATSDKESH